MALVIISLKQIRLAVLVG